MNPTFDKRNLTCYSDKLSGMSISTNVKMHVNIMLTALTNVGMDYLWYKDYPINNPTKVTKEHLERVFAYEFYHQWRKILESLGCTLYLNGEISKIIRGDMENNKISTLFPDIVLHGGQNCTEKRFQLLACEIKRKEGMSPTKFKEDITSLINYISEEYFTQKPFQCGVFILVGDVINTIKSKKYINKLRGIDKIGEFSKKIVCVSYNCKGDKQDIHIKPLFKILSN